jgi:hypothetical protein
MNFWSETEIKWICWNLIEKIHEITYRPENANKIMKNLTKTYVKSSLIMDVTSELMPRRAFELTTA